MCSTPNPKGESKCLEKGNKVEGKRDQDKKWYPAVIVQYLVHEGIEYFELQWDVVVDETTSVVR